MVSTRGHVEDGQVAHYQVTIRVGFTLEDAQIQAEAANDETIAMPAR